MNGDYYYMEISGRRICDDKIVEKEAPEDIGPSTDGGNVVASTSIYMKELLDDMLISYFQIIISESILSWNALMRFQMLERTIS